ncbi:peptidoglycan hydrolase-like protein with peptidoglycan-binding domain [Sedimentibacter acidaminivorans]|uniref:Peptidoglycan hydrolase-like protein with peptidoglycan-binding domain n=1 Tax=Sedimentibacter acidaminivorans TaxID=913099 RepID=A0ABS4G8Y3_9FIRM|nr:peptidoglycan-binding protein [Sedimentibacter acidaminivorans]MBP1924155.1 peptidoglycan hydrolase-like protein with peptidoglycan-binding domain [Sedimentibacter acidaminivorans]
MSISIPGLTTVQIPETITVHLGAPDEPAQNVTVSFIDYIKNVASSELYPTWPESALRANIYAIVSITLNRVFTEWYRSRGYDFDITNSTQFDQYFVKDRGIFDNISDIVDEVFNDYVVKQGQLQPFYTQYCDGRISQCDGMYQWGTVNLAKEGYVPYEILQYYYGEDINIVQNAPIGGVIETYPGSPLKLGDMGPYVLLAQVMLNTISINYPAIPKIYPVDGNFNSTTESAVREFQTIFGINPTGIIDKGTWYKIRNIYTSVRKLAELTSQGILISEIPKELPTDLSTVVPRVQLVQYFLNVLSAFYSTIQPVDIDGILGPQTRQSIIAFQKAVDIPVTGLIDNQTWTSMYNSVVGILNTLPPSAIALPSLLYQNILYKLGSEGPGVYIIQQYLSYISTFLTDIPEVTPDGEFGPNTQAAVIAFQNRFGLTPDGIVGQTTWDKIVEVYRDLRFGERTIITQSKAR